LSLKRLPAIPESARHPTFLLYPLIYVLCTVPLAAGRIASMAGNDVSLGYFCFAGSMIASAGWLDVVLYSTTRRAIVFSGEAPPSQDTGIETFAFMRTPTGRKFGNVVIVEGGNGTTKRYHDGKRFGKWNEKAVANARLRNLKGETNTSQASLKGFGSGQGEVMGMASKYTSAPRAREFLLTRGCLQSNATPSPASPSKSTRSATTPAASSAVI